MAHLLAVLMAAGLMSAGQPDVPQRAEFFSTVQLVQYFPGEYFNQRGRVDLHRVVLTRWPGPSGLLRLWREGQLQEVHRVSLLLGGAAFHDPQLLPMYVEGLESESERVRQAAAYGYRDLLADALPRVRQGVDDAAAAALAAEVRLMTETLRLRPLSAVWLDAFLLGKNRRLPGTAGIVPRRSEQQCLRSLDTILRPEDLELIMAAMAECETREERGALMPLVESLTLQTFRREPGQGEPWGSEVYRNAAKRLDRWRFAQCQVDFEEVLRDGLAQNGAIGIDPMSPAAFWVWYQILQSQRSSWWSLAARELYRHGAPPAFPSALRGGGKATEQERGLLLDALKTVPTGSGSGPGQRGRRPPPPPRPPKADGER